VVEAAARVGAPPDGSDGWGIAVVASHVTVGPGGVVPPKGMITEDVKGVPDHE
jgi:glucose-1-phosphate adenylyltransferase